MIYVECVLCCCLIVRAGVYCWERPFTTAVTRLPNAVAVCNCLRLVATCCGCWLAYEGGGCNLSLIIFYVYNYWYQILLRVLI